MPDFRVGFGESKLKELLVQCRCFIDRYGKTSHQLRLVIQVIYEYRLCHQRLNAKVPESVAAGIDELLAEFPDIHSDHIQIETNKTEYFAQCEKPFPEFAVSRHSVRDFSSEPVPLEKIKQATEEELVQVEGFGEIIAHSIAHYFRQEEHLRLLADALQYLRIKAVEQAGKTLALKKEFFSKGTGKQ